VLEQQRKEVKKKAEGVDGADFKKGRVAIWGLLTLKAEKRKDIVAAFLKDFIQELREENKRQAEKQHQGKKGMLIGTGTA